MILSLVNPRTSPPHPTTGALKMGLIKLGNISLTPLGLEKMRPNLGYAGAGARKLYQPDRTKAFDPQSPLSSLLVLVRASTMIATFKAGNKRKTTQPSIPSKELFRRSHHISLQPPHRSRSMSIAEIWLGWGQYHRPPAIVLARWSTLGFRVSEATNVTGSYKSL